ncbi:unnamed protein product [Peniophora sp. CBMAI 1063]|nr:unnamed protein product [Peniophora sp. CBMAI 1063]
MSIFEDAPDDYITISLHISETARKIFTSYADLKRLRESSRLCTSHTPAWATYREFRRGFRASWGIGAEALALILYHLASEEGFSGAKIDRYRDVAEFVWKKENEDEVDDDDFTWHKEDGYYTGNPATAPIVFRALNLAFDIDDQRRASRRSNGPNDQRSA